MQFNPIIWSGFGTGLRGWRAGGGYFSNPVLLALQAEVRNRKGAIQQNLGAERVRQGRVVEKGKNKRGKERQLFQMLFFFKR